MARRSSCEVWLCDYGCALAKGLSLSERWSGDGQRSEDTLEALFGGPARCRT